MVAGNVRTAEQGLVFGHALQAAGDFASSHALATRLLWGAAYVARNAEAPRLDVPPRIRSDRAARGLTSQARTRSAVGDHAP